MSWEAALELYGYEPEETIVAASSFQIVRATRPSIHGEPQIVVDVIELWQGGPDPLGHLVHRSHQGAFLSYGKAHAQIQPGDVGADRVDVGDVSKPVKLTIHRHPFGSPNDLRVPLGAMLIPAEWIHELEEIAAQIAGAWDDVL